jgi:hypothetical protein
MVIEFLPFELQLDTVMIASTTLWSLALYLALASVREWITEQLNRWFNFAERSLYTSQEEFERTRTARESQNAFYASIFSTLPFLVFGSLCNWVIELGLGRSWSVSVGILACMACAIYELGRRDGSPKD